MTAWTVAEFAARTGVPASTLRYWDEEGLLPAHRSSTGHRRYGPDDVARLEMVRMCQELGCTMAEVRMVLDAPDPAARATFAAAKLPEVLDRIEVLTSAAEVLRHVAVCSHQDAASCAAWMRTIVSRASTHAPGPRS